MRTTGSGWWLAAALLSVAAPASSQTEQVRLLGEIRVRGEAERPAGLDSVDALTLLRSRLAVEATLSPKAVVLVQVQDARVFGEEASTIDGSADRLDMHQAWLQYRHEVRGYGLSFRAGRQEIALGNERLVGAVNWTNTGRSFDGLRLSLGPQSGWTVHGFAATIAERGRRFSGAQPERGDHLLLGGYVETAVIDGFALHDREDAFRGYTDVDRTTLGARVGRTFGALTPSLEGAYQLGSQQLASAALAQDIRAWMIGARLAVAMPLPVLSRAGLGLDLLSGDADPADGTHRSFHTLYATNHKYYGYLDLFTDPAGRTRDRGLVNGIASARLDLGRELLIDVDAHGFWLHQEFAAASARHLGWELDLTLPIRLGPGQQLHVGYSAFRNGAAAPLIGLGRERDLWHWAYLQATFSFGGRSAPIL